MTTVRIVSLLVLRAGVRPSALPRLARWPLVVLMGGPIVPVTPSGSAVPGQGAVEQITNGIAWWALAASLLGLVIGAASWAIGSHAGNYQYTSAGKRAVVVSGLAALLIGAAPALIGFFFTTGSNVTQ